MRKIVLLRGDVFRGKHENQYLAYKSIKKHVLEPLLDKSLIIYIVTFNSDRKAEIEEFFSDYEIYYVTIPRNDQVCNFVNSINSIKEEHIEICEYLIILRSDLYFYKDIDYTNANENRICFQWNLFHDENTNEMADQIHLIGGSLLYRYKDVINKHKIDVCWEHSLHNMFNFCLEHFSVYDLSYLNYIENPNPKSTKCTIRGNPRIQSGNPLYTYTRFMK